METPNEKFLTFGRNPLKTLSNLQHKGKRIKEKDLLEVDKNEELNEVLSEIKIQCINFKKIPDITVFKREPIHMKEMKYFKSAWFCQLDNLYDDSTQRFLLQDSNNDERRVSPFGDVKDCNKNNNYRFICDICGDSFSNGQGLGGHMSRKHPNKSEKYKMKKETRERRNKSREIIYKAKRILLRKFNENYDNLINFAKGRKQIKKLVKENREEYLTIKRKIK